MQYTGWENDFQKAQNSGIQALKSLYLAQEKLNKVENQKFLRWFKRIPIQKNRKNLWGENTVILLANARRDMEFFQMILQATEICDELQAEIQCFLSYADFFFYGFTGGYLKLSEIEDARLQVEEAIDRVQSILLQMEHCQEKLE